MLRGIEGPAAQQTALRDAAARLGRALSLDSSELLAKLEPHRRFVWIKRRVSADEAAAIHELGDSKDSHPIHGS